jgi:GNAT superfamily N-acetyltransferase
MIPGCVPPRKLRQTRGPGQPPIDLGAPTEPIECPDRRSEGIRIPLFELGVREYPAVEVRDLGQQDLADLESLAEVVHDVDGYPIYLPSDLRGFIVSPDAHGAWVAVENGDLLGHVALHPRSWEGVMDLGRRATGLGDDALAVVARLLVSPTARRRGLGRALLQVAVSNARRMGLRPILDVVVDYEAAIRLYEAEGWERLGTVQFPLPDGRTVDEHVYLSPIPDTAPA